MKWLTYLFPGIYDRPPPSRPLRSNVGGSLLMMVGFQAVFALLCAIYTTICKRAVLSVVRRCSWSLILYLCPSYDRISDLLMIIYLYEYVNAYSRIKKINSQDLQQATLETTSKKYSERYSQWLKLSLDCEDVLETVVYLILLSSCAAEQIGEGAVNEEAAANVSAVVLAGILLLSCILDFIFWLTSSKHTTTRPVLYFLAMVHERCLQGGNKFKFVLFNWFGDTKLEAKSPEDVIENGCFDQQLGVLKMWHFQVHYSVWISGVLYVPVWFGLLLCIRLAYWSGMLLYELYYLEEYVLVS